MTEDEQYAIMGKVVHDLAESRKKLACLRSKAEQVVSDLDIISERIRNPMGKGFFVKMPELCSTQEIESLLAEIAGTEDRIQALEKRKTELGV